MRTSSTLVSSACGFFVKIQDKTRLNKTRQDKTKQDKTRQDKTKQNKARQGKARQGKARQDKYKYKDKGIDEDKETRDKA